MSTQTDITGFLDLQALQEAVIPLEPEHFDRAVERSRSLTPERHQWQIYLQELALCGLLSWLTARATEVLIQPQSERAVSEEILPCDGMRYLRVNGFTMCLLVTESVAQEMVTLPSAAIATTEFPVHLYVWLEVQEEQEQVILRGCLRADQLLQRIAPASTAAYLLPLDWFDPDANHLLFYLRFLAPASIPIPVAATPSPSPAIAALNQTSINVWNWSQTLMETATVAFSWSMPQPLTPAFALRRSPTKVEAAFQDLMRRQQLDIPEQAQYSYVTLTGTPFQLGAVSWLLSKERSQLEWALLLLVVAQPGQVMPLGTTLQVMTPTGLAAVTLETPDLYLYLLLEGGQDEAFTPDSAIAPPGTCGSARIYLSPHCRIMTSTPTFRLKVRKIDQFCLFDLFDGDHRELSATLKYPQHLTELYQNWQQIYSRRYQFQVRARVGRQSGSGTPMNYDWDQELRIAETALLTEFAYWLGQAELLPLREAIQRCLDSVPSASGHANQATSVDVLLECSPIDLARLPWETWALAPASAARSVRITRTSPSLPPAVSLTQARRSQPRRSKIRILAILADAPDLNHEVDQQTLRSLLPLATIEFIYCYEILIPLQATDRSRSATLKQHIAQAIADPRGWDVLFFAGHSDEATLTGGKLELAPQINLAIQDIELQLVAAMQRGLHLAVFNSCSGLSIADALIRVGIPQVVVMRERIQDTVAHKFLEQFCRSLAGHHDVQQAVIHTTEYFAAEHISYPSVHLIISLFRHPDPGVPLFQIERSRLKRVWHDWKPTRWEAIAVSTLAFLSLLVPFQELLFELRYVSQAVYRQATHQLPAAQPPAVTVLKIDQASIDRRGIDAYKIKPMSRAYLAEIIERLRQLKVKTIGIDYILDGTTKEDEKFATVVQQAIQQQTWFVFPTHQNDAGQWIRASATIANPNSILQGNIDLLNWHVMLPETLPCRTQCPFPYQLVVAHSLRATSLTSVAPAPNLQQVVNQTLPHMQPTHRLHTFLQQPETPLGLQPIIDFSLPPHQVQAAIAAWDFLERPLTDPTLQALQNQIVIIGSGGYDRAEDNFAAPLAIRYWRSFKDKSASSQETLRSQVLPGAAVHAYAVYHILSQHLLLQVPTLWMIGLAAFLGKGTTQLLVRQKPQRYRHLGIGLIVGTGLYGVTCLQIYVTAAIVLPWFLPSVLFWLYVLPAFSRTNNGS